MTKKPDAAPPFKDGEAERDQSERPYYYDDAYGYTVYSEPDGGENDDDEEDDEASPATKS